MYRYVEAIFQLGNVFDLMGNYPAAIKQFEILNTKVTHDPGILARLGAIHAKMDDEVGGLCTTGMQLRPIA